MANIINIQKGTKGVLKLHTENGSLLYLRNNYLDLSSEIYCLEPVCLEVIPFEINDDVLILASEAYLAEKYMLSLLARAEQYKLGLENKIKAKKLNTKAIKMASNYLEECDFISDYRYASSWIRQKCRSKKIKIGPSGIKAKLLNKGVEKKAVQKAMSEFFTTEVSKEIIFNQIENFLKTSDSIEEIKYILFNFGWNKNDVNNVIEESFL